MSDFESFVKAFYESSVHADAKSTQDVPVPTQNVDRPFLSAVWGWLTKNPHIILSITSAPHPSLSEAKSLSPQPRLKTSQRRIWLALTGHEPSRNKVFDTEIALLSIIASHKSAGILQTDLTRSSGQDKRSVPKRTDALAAKGYIEKRTVLTTQHRTSLCILKRFFKESERSLVQVRSAGDGTASSKIIDLQALGKSIVSALKGKESLSPVELNEILVSRSEIVVLNGN